MSEEAAQGLEVVAGHWPVLTDDELGGLLERYPAVGGPVRTVRTSARPLSAASVVATGAGQFVVKRQHRDVRDASALVEEHAFGAYLRARGVPVPEVPATRDGGTAVEVGSFAYEVQRAADGEDRYVDAHTWTPFRDTADAAAAGRALAGLHAASAGFDRVARPLRPLSAAPRVATGADPVAVIHGLADLREPLARLLGAADDWPARWGQLLGGPHAALAQLRAASAERWGHLDWQAWNLFFRGAGAGSAVSGVIDLTTADRSSCAHDLDVAVERNCLRWLDILDGDDGAVHLDHADALLGGYAEVRPLGADERAAVAAWLPLCQVDFALAEADYFLGVEGSWPKARWCLDVFLEAHVAWFSTAAGRRVLHRVAGG